VDFWGGKKVLVTGGNGFIGSYVVEFLVAAGARVSVTASSAQSNLSYVNAVRDDIRIFFGDLRDLSHCEAITPGQDIVMNLAARVGGISYNIAHPGSIFRDNLLIFTNVLEASREAGVERFLVTSSACVYPRFCSIPTPESEGYEGRPEPTNEGYGLAKRMEEFLGDAYHREFGMRIAIARPYNAYGPRDNFDAESSHVIPGLICRIYAGENPLIVWGDATHSRSFLYVKDFARGLMEVTEKYAESDAVNLGADEEVTIGELARMLVELSGKKIEIVFDPSRPGGQPRRKCDTRKAREKVGFEARVPFREGLAETLRWYEREVLARAA
jgi:GDP-L-fucose synthase